MFVTFGEYTNTDNVWRTTNSGADWELRVGSGNDSLPPIHINTIRYHPTNTNWIYVGTDLGVFASENKGSTWSITPRYASNEGPVNVEVDELFWQGNDYLIAATYGRGMFRCRLLVTVYVDKTNVGTEDGTQAHPYNTLLEGYNAAGNGTMISVKSAEYTEAPFTFRKRGIVQATNGSVVIK